MGAHDLDRLVAVLAAALRGALDPEEFDVTRGEGANLAIETDEWTLHVESWPDGPVWLAIDDEPDDPARYETARRAVMSEAVEWALAETDRALDRGLSRALLASGDPFSMSFAARLLEIVSPAAG